MRRAILAIGRQDIDPTSIQPRADMQILGASSDHLLLNAKNIDLNVGDEVQFDLQYGALLKAMVSPYVEKKYLPPMLY
jgi:predicted amino acid racemase